MDLLDLLVRHEGFRQRVYCDRCGQPLMRFQSSWICNCPHKGLEPGNLTVGIGSRIDGAGMTLEEARGLAAIRLAHLQLQLESDRIYAPLDVVRKAALSDMAYTMGVGGLMSFTFMFQALEVRDFDSAARAVLDSKWALEAPARAKEIAAMLRTGQWPDELERQAAAGN